MSQREDPTPNLPEGGPEPRRLVDQALDRGFALSRRALAENWDELGREILERGSDEGMTISSLSDDEVRRNAAEWSEEFRHRKSEFRHKRREHFLQYFYAILLFLALVLQMGFADWIFDRYASSHSIHWSIPTSTMNVWLGATVVQLVGIVGIVVHYLFRRDYDAAERHTPAVPRRRLRTSE